MYFDCRVICEQVSHHPPISAFHAENEAFIFRGSIYPKLKFWGKSVEIQPEGTVTVELKKYNFVLDFPCLLLRKITTVHLELVIMRLFQVGRIVLVE